MCFFTQCKHSILLSSSSNSTTTTSTQIQFPLSFTYITYRGSAANISTTGFTAKWNRLTGATSYKIDVSTSSDFSTFLTNYNNKDAGNDTTAIVSSLTPGTTYYYRVRAYSSSNSSGNSNSITVSTENLPVPSTPVTKEAANITTTSFTASWYSSSDATNYSIDVSTDEAFSNILPNYNDKKVGSVILTNVSDLIPSTRYYYRIRASNSGGTSPNSNSISVTTLLAAPLALAQQVLPKTDLRQIGMPQLMQQIIGWMFQRPIISQVCYKLREQRCRK